MNYIDKNELHQLIDKCEGEAVLYKVKAMLTNKNEDWWETDFTKEEQEEMLEAAKQVEAGQFHTQEEVHKMMEEWKRK